MKLMFEKIIQIVNDASSVVVIQAENPDGDSLGTALALEEILGDKGKKVQLHCSVDVPKYLQYIKGWDRVTSDFDTSADMAIIVDTAADILLSKTLATPGVRHFLESHPVVVMDHHATESNLSFPHELASADAISSSEVLFKISQEANWDINAQAAEHLMVAQMSDSLGLTTPNVTAESFYIAGELTKLGAVISNIEERRRELSKKSPEILAYKGRLIERVEYYLDGRLALVHVPFEEIEKYSDKYNPGALIGDELRLVEGVAVGVVLKTYPDGKVTARLRSNLPVSEQIAGFFGGGGHAYASGFRTYDDYDTIVNELISATDKALS